MTELSKYIQQIYFLASLERPFGPICAILALFALWRQMEVPTYFFCSFERVDDFT